MVCVTKICPPHKSVTLYVLVIVSGHVKPSDTSPTKETTGTPWLSASSVTTNTSAIGTSPIHSTLIGRGLDAVGKNGSVIIIKCVTLIVFPHSSVTL